jgi:ABC-type multidrug transport system fused ATPase/permease subunit
MIQKSPDLAKTFVYRAPTIYVALFYLLLVAWTILCILFISFKVTQSQWGNLFQLFMIAFIIAMTWYFSMGISYRVNMEEDGTLRLTSFRRILRIDPRKMELIEGPHLPIGFIRFRLEREKAYLFGIPKNKDLQQILSNILKTNQDVKFKNLNLMP